MTATALLVIERLKRPMTGREICAAIHGDLYTGRQLWAVLGAVDWLTQCGLILWCLERRGDRDVRVYVV